jgi:D-xylose transport system substrate-binding protein
MMRFRIALVLVLAFPFLTGWGHWGPAVKIGLSLDHAQGREILVKKLKEELEENRADLLLTDAKNDPKTQESQVKDLIAQGIQALIVLPAEPSKAAALVEAAHQAGIKVLSLDHFIPNSGLDYLVAFDPQKTGSLQSRAMTDRVPKGVFLLLGNEGLWEGWMKGLKTSLDRGDIRIVASLSPQSQNAFRTQLKKEKKVEAILASDAEATSRAVKTLEAEGLLGKIPLAGIGEDLQTCRRILSGTQVITVYDPPQKLAEEAAYLAAKVARKAKEFDCQFTEMENSGSKTLAVLLTPEVVDAKNLDSTIIKDGVQNKEEVYRK